MKKFARKALRIATVVIHDPEVQRTGRQFAAKIAIRIVLAAGGSAFFVELAHKHIA